ncbi:MAG: oligosaccharide flippase family protein [Candidatus Eisenbacteria bacterium]|nr:oligosaccharide flippase family protein [Candidatus Eisenbacteria bacterium]
MSNRRTSIFTSQELGPASVTFTGLQVFRFLLAYVAGIVIARALGPSNKGIYNLALLLPALMTQLACWGQGSGQIYLLGRNREVLSRLLPSGLSLSLIFSLSGSVLYVVFALTVLPIYFKEARTLHILLAGLAVPFQISTGYLYSFLLGLKMPFQLGLVQSARVGIYLLLLLLLVIGASYGITGALIANLVGWIIGLAVILLLLLRFARLRLGWDKKLVSDVVAFSSKSHIANLLGFLSQRIALFLMGMFLAPRQVGIYALAVAISEILLFPTRSVATILFPEIASITDDRARTQLTNRAARITMLFTLVCAAVMQLIAHPLIMLLYGPPYAEAVLLLRILLIGIVVRSLAAVLYGDLSGRGMPQKAIVGVSVSMVVSTALCFLLIPRWGMIGASVASVATQTASAVVGVILYVRVTDAKFADLVAVRGDDLRKVVDVFVKLLKQVVRPR